MMPHTGLERRLDQLQQRSSASVTPPPLTDLTDRFARRRKRRRSAAVLTLTVTAVLVSVGVAQIVDNPSDSTPVAIQAGDSPPRLADGTWIPISTGPLTPRFHHSAVWTGTEMIAWGGVGKAAEAHNDGAAYDPATDTWRLLAASPLDARSGHAALWTGTEMLIVGGADRAGRALSDLAAYDPRRDAWRVLPDPPKPLGHRAAVVWTGSEVISWSGQRAVTNLVEPIEDPVAGSAGPAMDGLAPGAAAGEGVAFDLSTSAWREIAEAPIAGRVAPAATWTAAGMLVWGGETGDIYHRNFSDGAIYDPDEDEWSTLDFEGMPGPSAAWAVARGGRVFIAGGIADASTSQPSSTILALDVNGGGAELSDPVPQPTWGPALAWTGREIAYWGGGIPPDGGYTNDGFAFDPATGEWSRLAEAPLSARQFASGVWAGERLIVWGGFSSVAEGDGAALVPAL